MAQVRVLGFAQRRVLPDIAQVRIEIRTQRFGSPQEALSEAIAARERLRQRIGFRLAGTEAYDTRITAQPEHAQQRRPQATGPEYPGGGEQTEWVVVGYTGVGAITLRASASRAAEMVMAVADHPDAHGVEPTFELDPPTERRHRDELQREALRDARTRADGLAKVLGCRAGRPLLVDTEARSGEPEYGNAMYARAAMAEAGGGGGQEVSELTPEPLDIESRVRACFALSENTSESGPGSRGEESGYA